MKWREDVVVDFNDGVFKWEYEKDSQIRRNNNFCFLTVPGEHPVYPRANKMVSKCSQIFTELATKKLSHEEIIIFV